MFRFAGRGAPQDQAEAAALLEKAAKLGHVAAMYNLALLYLDGRQVSQNAARAAELFRSAADAGSPDAQYALATLYKDRQRRPEGSRRGRETSCRCGAQRQRRRAGRIRDRAVQRHRCATKDESGAANLFRKVATRGNTVAQNRLARILATGRGLLADPVAAVKWHTIAKASGASDVWLENYMQTIKEADRAAGENAARLWLVHAQPRG